MRYGKITNGVLIQVQPDKAKGFIEIPDDAVCGQLYDGKVFTNPPPTPKSVEDKIADIEATITPRRLREAAIGVQASIDFIAVVDVKITALRATLK